MARITFITESVYPYFKGGQEKRIYEYARALRRDHTVRVVSMHQWSGERVMTKDDIIYEGVCRRLPIYHKSGKRNVAASVYFGIATFFYVLRSRDDILDIDIFPYFPLIFARIASVFMRRKPIIIGYWAEYWGQAYWKKYYPLMWWVGVALERISYRCCDQMVANSVFTRDNVTRAFPHGTKTITVIPPASVDLTVIDAVAPQEKRYDMIYYGRIIAHKHVDHIVDVVIRSIKDGMALYACIIGDGPDKQRIADMIAAKNLGRYITLMDFVDRYPDLIAEVKGAKVMVQPSEREGFGITVIEAQACGLPVFVMDYPDNAGKQLITHGVDGYICQSVDDLYEKIKQIMIVDTSLVVHAQLSHNARLHAQQFAKDTVRKRITSYYKNL